MSQFRILQELSPSENTLCLFFHKGIQKTLKRYKRTTKKLKTGNLALSSLEFSEQVLCQKETLTSFCWLFILVLPNLRPRGLFHLHFYSGFGRKMPTAWSALMTTGVIHDSQCQLNERTDKHCLPADASLTWLLCSWACLGLRVPDLPGPWLALMLTLGWQLQSRADQSSGRALKRARAAAVTGSIRTSPLCRQGWAWAWFPAASAR